VSVQTLPNKEQAWVQEIKIIGYLLKSDHSSSIGRKVETMILQQV